MFLIRSSSTGKLCAGKFWFSLTIAIMLIKFATAEITSEEFTTGPFDSTGGAMILGIITAGFVKREGDKAGNIS